jgi:hypothetical protein
MNLFDPQSALVLNVKTDPYSVPAFMGRSATRAAELCHAHMRNDPAIETAKTAWDVNPLRTVMKK